MRQRQTTRDSILRYLQRHRSASGPELAEHLGITRQAVSSHLRMLIDQRRVFKTGSTRAARYFPAEAAEPGRRIKRELEIPGLDEADVYETVALSLNLARLPDNVEAIVHYGFTEMLNNAIDHSMADRCAVQLSVDVSTVRFAVRDRGIGVFHSIADKLDLPDQHAAMIELIKGRTTTMPQAHSGEGIFFVARSADRFSLRSHRIQIEWDRLRDDVFVSEPRFLKGTLVEFEIGRSSRLRLEDVFAEFAPEKYDFRFEKTRVLVKLLQRDYVSRSEAKRLLLNLDKFSEIELDMRDVISVGQGFADEVFRVFHRAHPETSVRVLNASDAVDAMIRHVGESSS